MMKRIFGMIVCALMVISAGAQAKPDLSGVWDGPEGLQMILISNPATGTIKVPYCGILRVRYWDAEVSLKGNALTLKGYDTDYTTPTMNLTGSFTLDSGSYMTGTLRMGDRDDEYYFNGATSFSKTRPLDAKVLLDAFGGLEYRFSGNHEGMKIYLSPGVYHRVDGSARAQDDVDFYGEYDINGYNIEIRIENPYIAPNGVFVGTFSKDMKTLTIHNYSDGVYDSPSRTLTRVE